MTYMSARTASFLGLEYFDTFITMVFSNALWWGACVVLRLVNRFALRAG